MPNLKSRLDKEEKIKIRTKQNASALEEPREDGGKQPRAIKGGEVRGPRKKKKLHKSEDRDPPRRDSNSSKSIS